MKFIADIYYIEINREGEVAIVFVPDNLRAISELYNLKDKGLVEVEFKKFTGTEENIIEEEKEVEKWMI